jgi:hypothetical protein
MLDYASISRVPLIDLPVGRYSAASRILKLGKEYVACYN